MSRPKRTIWAYRYRLMPPQTPDRLHKIKALLAQESREAARRKGVWQGRVVVEDRASHILVLSDSPDLDLQVNQRLEDALRAIDAAFAVTVPLAVTNGRTYTSVARAVRMPAKKAVTKAARKPAKQAAPKPAPKSARTDAQKK